MSTILRVRDENGNVVAIPAIKGERGNDGKSAYECAVEGGYEGSEEEFNASIAGIDEIKKSVADGKSSLASTVSDAGVTTASDADFETINANFGTALANKYNAGYEAGESAGEATGYSNGYEAGESAGYSNGYSAGETAGISATKKGDAETGDVLKGKSFTSESAGVDQTGTLPNLSEETEIDYSSSNTTPVIEGDTALMGTNSDGTKRLGIRYSGVKGVITNNTLLGIIASFFGNTIASKVLKGTTFTSEAGIAVDGAMEDYSSNVQTVTPSASQTGTEEFDIPDGYHTNVKVNSANVYNAGVTYADGRANADSTNYKTGYNAGVAAADARVNTSSASYTSGYNAGVTAGGSGKYTLSTETLSGSGSIVSTEAGGYSTTITLTATNNVAGLMNITELTSGYRITGVSVSGKTITLTVYLSTNGAGTNYFNLGVKVRTYA